MKKSKLLIMVLLMGISLQVSAQQKERPREEGQERMEAMTEAQKKSLKTILSNYDSQTLTAEEAKAIHEAFREAGLRAGPSTDDGLREMGFSPEKLRHLAPPPEMEGNKKSSENNHIQHTESSVQQKNGFTVTSAAVKADGSLLADFTGDGRGISMPLEWTNVPKGTTFFALNLWHLPHPTANTSEVKSYWVIYNIPGDVRQIPKNVQGLGIDGYNDKDHTGYDPMRSKGPGVKEYHLTIYALSEKATFSTSKVKRTDLLKAIEGITLGESTLNYTYERGTTK